VNADKNNVRVSGTGIRPMLFAHGFGCDQSMWRHVAPAFEADYKVVTFDHIGAGGSDLSAYDRDRYSSLAGYADDVLDICRGHGLRDVVFVGHSVSAMIGVLAAVKDPTRFSELVLVAPSPATSTTVSTWAASRGKISTDCWTSWTATIWPGRACSGPRSWATPTDPSWPRS
jgi:pimeloyl-ACP methyl ester carboxylesterase